MFRRVLFSLAATVPLVTAVTVDCDGTTVPAPGACNGGTINAGDIVVCSVSCAGTFTGAGKIQCKEANSCDQVIIAADATLTVECADVADSCTGLDVDLTCDNQKNLKSLTITQNTNYDFSKIETYCECSQTNFAFKPTKTEGCACKQNYFGDGSANCVLCDTDGPGATSVDFGTFEERCTCLNAQAAVTGNSIFNPTNGVCKCKVGAFGEKKEDCAACPVGTKAKVNVEVDFGTELARCECANERLARNSLDGDKCQCKRGFFSKPGVDGDCDPCPRGTVPAFAANGIDLIGIGNGAESARCRCGLVYHSDKDTWDEDTTKSKCTLLKPSDEKVPVVIKIDGPISIQRLLAPTDSASRESITAALVACAVSTLAATLAF